jgi:heptosyltransferase-1
VICDTLNIQISQDDIFEKKPFLFSQNHIKQQSKIIFIVGASKINKIYPKERFLELAQRLNENIEVVWGDKDEYNTALWLSEQSNLIEIAPKGDLNDLKSKIQNAKLVIGADTGPTHIAWALNIPSITIFGNTPEYRNTYITNINKVVKSDSYVDPLNLDKNDFSIQDIKANQIYKIAKELLKC